jgi:hypothetical protein
MEWFLEPNKFWTGEKREKGKGVVCRFHSNIHGEVREGEKEGVCDPVTCCGRDICFIRGENYA